MIANRQLLSGVGILDTALNLSGQYPPPSWNRYRLAHEECFMDATQQRFSVIGDKNLNDLRSNTGPQVRARPPVASSDRM